jgi:menaquinone-dependent protoporphyrinogen oxidase
MMPHCRGEVGVSRVLVLYGTTDGHTAKVASAIANTLRARGCAADVVCAGAPGGDRRAADYNGVIVTASVHEGTFQRPVRRWVRANGSDLVGRPTAFAAVCLAVLEHRAEAQRGITEIVERFLVRSAWRPDAVKLVAGAVPYTRYGWLKKLVMKRICAKAGGGTDTTRDYEYTDWHDVRNFVEQFAATHGLVEPAPADEAPVPAVR